MLSKSSVQKSVLFSKINTCSLWIGVSILIIQFLLICYYNLTLGKESLDPDMAKLYVHAIEMWKNKTYLIEGWSYITTLELDCSLLLAVPLFGILNDIYLAFGISNIIFLLLFIYSIFRIFSSENIFYAIIALVFILIPYSYGSLEWFNMLFFNGSQYNIKIIIPLMLISLLKKYKADTSFERVEHILFSVVFLSLTTITAFSSGIYVFITGLFPIIFSMFLYHKYTKDKLSSEYYIYSISTLIATLVGIGLNIIFKINPKGNSMTLCSVTGQLQENISSCLIGIFELFGAAAYQETEVLSYEGINILFRFFFVTLLLLCGYLTAKSIKERKESYVSTALLSIFVWNTFILLICDTKYGALTYEYRYHLMGMIPMICIASVKLVDTYQKLKNNVKVFAIFSFIVCTIFLNITSYNKFYPRIYPEMNEICEYVQEVNANFVCFANGDSMNAEICRLLDYKNEDTVYLTIKKDDTLIVYDYYNKYIGNNFELENAIILSDEQIEFIEFEGKIYYYNQELGGKYLYI